MEEKHHCCNRHAMHVALKLTKLALKAATVAAAFAIAKEVHGIHCALGQPDHRRLA